MTIAHFLLLDAEVPDESVLDHGFLKGEYADMVDLPGVERGDRYDPVEFDHDFNDDDERPLIMLQTCFTDVESLEQALQSDTFRKLVDTATDGTGCTVSHDALEMHMYPVADEDEAGEWTAPISFVVRYHHPAEDVEKFVSFYVANHPVIERRFPDIRSIMCYTPVSWNDPTGLKRLDYMLGNEVVFDSVEALGAALASPVMDEMMEDFANFPPFSGKNTHFAMDRRRAF